MKHYPKYPTSISALAFSPDGTKLAIGASNEHDNSLASADPESNQVLLMIKDTVMEDSKVSSSSSTHKLREKGCLIVISLRSRRSEPEQL